MSHSPRAKHYDELASSQISLPKGAGKARRFLAFIGPGLMISVGYMDPGNWATSLEGGSRFGYTLLFIVLVSSLMAIVLQSLCARLGIATDMDLAQACRRHFSRPVNVALWFLCELAIIACDLAEVIGTAIAIKLLFGLPVWMGAILTILDTLVLLMLIRLGFRWLEAFVGAMLIVIFMCFAIELVLAQPSFAAIAHGFLVPDQRIITQSDMLYIAIGIIGATVMPHNLYLHSALVKTRAFERNETGRREAIRWASLDSTLSLIMALFVNAGILILAAAVFFRSGNVVTEIEQAYELISPLVGVTGAASLFGIALLASGLNSTITATLAGQVVMEGFLSLRMSPVVRRLITRGLAIIPVLIVIGLYGEQGAGRLLILSQVILSLQLPFAVIPLLWFVSSRKEMGPFVIGWRMRCVAWLIAFIILVLNILLLKDAVNAMLG